MKGPQLLTEAVEGSIFRYVEASLQDKLTDRGWERCQHSGCDGRGNLVVDPPQACPDCVEGLVPPEGMVETALESVIDMTFHPHGAPPNWSGREFARQQIVVTLLAAARWEREQ